MFANPKTFVRDAMLVALGQFLKRPIPAVLMYHSVDESSLFFSVRSNTFEKQLDFLVSQGREFVSIGQISDSVRSGKKISRKSLCLTFDDGYRTVLKNALPILERYDIPCAIYIPTGFVLKGASPKGLPVMLTKELQSLAQHPLVTLGAHTASHPDLCTLTDDAAMAEISDGKAQLEDWISQKVSHFAYPYGSVSSRIREMVANCGFETAVTVRRGGIEANVDPLMLPRLPVDKGISMIGFRHWTSTAATAFFRVRGF